MIFKFGLGVAGSWLERFEKLCHPNLCDSDFFRLLGKVSKLCCPLAQDLSSHMLRNHKLQEDHLDSPRLAVRHGRQRQPKIVSNIGELSFIVPELLLVSDVVHRGPHLAHAGQSVVFEVSRKLQQLLLAALDVKDKAVVQLVPGRLPAVDVLESHL